jgi:DNA-binding response OmpR family regulator
MPELGSDAEPTRLLLVMRASDEVRALIEALKVRQPELRVDLAEGVVSGLAHLFESPPDILLIDATMPGIDASVICRELSGLSISSRFRVMVGRPRNLQEMDGAFRDAGASAIMDTPVAVDEVCENLAHGSFDVTRIKAS